MPENSTIVCSKRIKCCVAKPIHEKDLSIYDPEAIAMLDRIVDRTLPDNGAILPTELVNIVRIGSINVLLSIGDLCLLPRFMCCCRCVALLVLALRALRHIRYHQQASNNQTNDEHRRQDTQPAIVCSFCH